MGLLAAIIILPYDYGCRQGFFCFIISLLATNLRSHGSGPAARHNGRRGAANPSIHSRRLAASSRHNTWSDADPTTVSSTEELDTVHCFTCIIHHSKEAILANSITSCMPPLVSAVQMVLMLFEHSSAAGSPIVPGLRPRTSSVLPQQQQLLPTHPLTHHHKKYLLASQDSLLQQCTPKLMYILYNELNLFFLHLLFFVL